MFDACRTPQDVAYLYTHRYGFRARVFDRRAYFLVDTDWGAIDMPFLVGRQVKAELGEEHQVPIIRHGHRTERWVFVVRRNRGHLLHRWLTALGRIDIRLIGKDARVWLPMTHAGLGWTWHSPPTVGVSPPSRRQVLDAALAVISADHIPASRAGKA